MLSLALYDQCKKTISNETFFLKKSCEETWSATAYKDGPNLKQEEFSSSNKIFWSIPKLNCFWKYIILKEKKSWEP